MPSMEAKSESGGAARGRLALSRVTLVLNVIKGVAVVMAAWNPDCGLTTPRKADATATGLNVSP